MTNPSPPSEFLLERFDAIREFDEKVLRTGTLRSVHQVKYCYFLGYWSEESEPELFRLCQELERYVPIDHPYWISS